ncbi:GGDEF domain-containing protein [Inhella gelatinilytica]|uniref:diguanylate cyclase n=1 Tax=Inhella gelatinilytica TaxID=2795030 RepID=A0A931NCF4_9BURK|nr:GGDEF domain-containing protein [Inhella gelatinilytica]MBH9551509.1 GGDEF domain-containing protein [Inhella gelatinilytica]
MTLHLPTLLTALLLHVLWFTAALPRLVGRPMSVAMRWVQLSLGLQSTVAVGALIHAHWPLPSAVQLLAFAALGAAVVAAQRGVQAWMGKRPLSHTAWVMGLAGPPLLAGAWFYQPLLVEGLAASWLALLVAVLIVALVAPAPQAPELHTRWSRLWALTLLPAQLLFIHQGMTLWGAPPPATWSLALYGSLMLASWGMTSAVLAGWRGEADGRLRHQTKTDALTQLANRRAFEQRGNEMMAVARRHREPLALMVLDVDHFKQVIDLHGHTSGDEALGLLARLMRNAIRPGDCAARLGGEQFGVLLARTQGEGVEALDARIRATLESSAEQELGFVLDYSAGWSLMRSGDRHVEDMVRRADAGLWAAKHQGRGRLCAEPGLAPHD